MKENDKCIILKRKEYDELVAAAEANKPDYILIKLYSHYNHIESNLELSDNLYHQIFRIKTNLLDNIEKIEKRIETQIEIKVFKTLANMSRSERRKFLKEWKNQ